MSAPVWVLDTNVIVSGLLCAHGHPARLLDALVDGRLRLAFDDRIEAEYREVLARPRLAISPERREAFLALLSLQKSVAARPWTGEPLPDPVDLPFLEVALGSTEQTLVTGNSRHYPPTCRGSVKLLSPRQAWETLREQGA
jgi:putative PIN family toxin of toxin-antitoxin system